MKERLFVALLLVLVLLTSSSGCLYRYRSKSCRQRGTALSVRVEKLKRDALEEIKIGTKKEAVIRFFAKNDIPVTFSGNEATGTIQAGGCAPSGCGSDNSIIGLRVKTDEAGTVISDPVVWGGGYTNCL
jgi:hypothetical protein